MFSCRSGMLMIASAQLFNTNCTEELGDTLKGVARLVLLPTFWRGRGLGQPAKPGKADGRWICGANELL
eukprot:s649_g37.t5